MNYGSNYFDGSGSHGSPSDMYSQQQKDDEIKRLRARIAELEAREKRLWDRAEQKSETDLASMPRDLYVIEAWKDSDGIFWTVSMCAVLLPIGHKLHYTRADSKEPS